METGKNKTEDNSSSKGGDYLWDGSGPVDPEVQKLERLLGRFQHNRPTPVFPEIVPERR